ncbi:class I adenylate cyclase [Aliikangiella marina]|uniref:class I adenylate cyclase n=1 Tax=Aliikangiella marina TaxID=1712262 RepID=UPI00163D7427|nr:class I adenylate cyclase [Aliikangiella marina]
MTQKSIDRKHIINIQRRFLSLSEKRLLRMLDGFNLTQADSIKLLPLLFHVNHPMLPGYVDKSTPCGLPNYSPTALEKRIARTVSRSFKYESRAYLKFELAGLYLMGSIGTLGQSFRSDLDLWVCLGERLGAIEMTKLHQKTQLISAWMSSKGVELNCYLVYEKQFAQQAKKYLTKDSCGDTQNYLLLDEFYRTAVWLCGRTPLWWIIPPEENYREYANRLVKDKHIDALDWIDFGEVGQIPAAEFFSAALWQLFKAIASPYKSSLKLLMIEKYAREFPEVSLLSDQFKQMVYSQEDSIEKLDPYLMMFRAAESFLADQPARLSFLRRAFYLKAGSKIDLARDKPNNWRYQQMKFLVENWRWKQKTLDEYNSRSDWRIDTVIRERVDLVRELNHSYHFISNFARIQGALNQVSQQELVTLGRMLYATFEKRAGKIDRINTGIARDVQESAITLEMTGNHWRVFLGALRKNQLNNTAPVYTSESFFVALAWCVCNEMLNRNSTFQVYSDDEFYDFSLAAEIVRNLASLVRNSQPQIDETAFRESAKILTLGIFLNTETDPLQVEKESDIYSVANQEDGFCWGENRVNLFSQFDVFWVNSWGEYGSKKYSGEFAWIEFFFDYRQVITNQEDKIQLFAQQIPNLAKHKKRLFKMLHQWNRLRLDSRRKQRTNRYLMSYGSQFLLIDFFETQVEYKSFRYAKQLLTGLSNHLKEPIQYFHDDNLDLPAIIIRLLNKPAEVDYQCFILQTAQNSFQVVIKDPAGNFFYQVHSGVSREQLVNHYQQFYDGMLHQLGNWNTPMPYLMFWYADISYEDNARLQRIKDSHQDLANQYSAILAIAVRNTEDKVRYDLYIDEEVFRYQDFGELVYRKLAQFVLGKRQSQRQYPIFITNIDLSSVSQGVRVMDLLRHKRVIEQKLANALSKLTRH